jgi:hypothetical protein
MALRSDDPQSRTAGSWLRLVLGGLLAAVVVLPGRAVVTVVFGRADVAVRDAVVGGRDGRGEVTGYADDVTSLAEVVVALPAVVGVVATLLPPPPQLAASKRVPAPRRRLAVGCGVRRGCTRQR